ncbi:MAG TPA: hypothetical protein VNU21_11390 [Usitatibacter sp.]|nr:hypothetical protein [Usitatibacter sp.]
MIGKTIRTQAAYDGCRISVPAQATRADRLVRVVYLEHTENNARIRDLIDRLNQLDEQRTIERLTFAERAGRWKEAA